MLESASDEGFLNADRALFTARVDAGERSASAQTVALGVDVARFHYFDADTGARLAAEPRTALAGAQRMSKQRETRESVLELIESSASATRSRPNGSSASTSPCRA